MPYIPHSDQDIQHILKTIGINKITDLFDEIPPELAPPIDDQFIKTGLSEPAISRLIHQRRPPLNYYNFIGAGAYEHHIPAAISGSISRGEFYSAYTPYQAEASQGGLQVIYEYQSMMTKLMAMEVSNASLYDGATAIAEAALMACRIKHKQQPCVMVPNNLHPSYRAVLNTILGQQDIEIIDIDYTDDGLINTEQFSSDCPRAAAVIIPQLNFFGHLEPVNELTDIAHGDNTLVIAVVNPMTCASLIPPGEWGEQGADIACGEGQPLGIPLAGGGPYFGLLCTKKQFIRQLPGRIVAQTVDTDGKQCFTLTLQAREQHIRRGKATSNICTNQGLMVTAACIYLQLMGSTGLQQTTEKCHDNTQLLINKLTAINGVERVFSSPFWQETVIRFNNHSVQSVLTTLETLGIQAGFNLTPHYPELGECLLVCATETKTPADIDYYVNHLTATLGSHT